MARCYFKYTLRYRLRLYSKILILGILLVSRGVKGQTQIGIDIDGEAAYDGFGRSVSMPDAFTVAIGAWNNGGNGIGSGHVRVYFWNGMTWVQKGQDIDGESSGDQSGVVSMPDANTVAIGAYLNDGNGTNSGHVRVYAWNGTSWVQKGLDINGEFAGDESGRAVSMPDSNTIAIGAQKNGGAGFWSGHVRVYSWNGISWVQKGLDIDGEAANTTSGCSVSMSDANTVAIGAPWNFGTGFWSGHTRVYSWNGVSWVQKGLDIDGEFAEDRSGGSVSMPDSNTVAIGATGNDGNGTMSGHVRVYSWNGVSWVQKGLDIDGESAGDGSGVYVSMLDSNTVAIGAMNNDGNGIQSGHIRVYFWNGMSWVQKGLDIDGEAALDISGISVSMPDANTVAVGAAGNDGNGINSGHVRVYSLCTPTSKTDTILACGSYTWIDGNTYSSSNNSATHNLTSPNGCDSLVFLNLTISSSYSQKGLDIEGESARDFSGKSISMPDANTIAIGASWNDGNGIRSGHVRVYSWNGMFWVQKGLDIDGESTDDLSGESVSMPDANTVAIGAVGNDGNGTNSGHVRVFVWNGTSWVQKGLDIDGEFAGDWSGGFVSMPDANTIAIGARNNGGNGMASGHVRVYLWNGVSWVQKGLDIDGESSGDESGVVSMPDANTVAIGAVGNDGNGTNSGHVRVFVWNGTSWVQKGLDIDGEFAGDWSGGFVSMPDANTIAIGARNNGGNGMASGHVRVYLWNGVSWVQKGLDIDGESSGDESGVVSMPDANTVAIGAGSNNGNGIGSGHVRVYSWNGMSWVQKGLNIDGESVYDGSGISVSMPNPNTVAIGADGNDGNGNNSGHVRAINLYHSVNIVSSCNSYTWIDGNTYTSSNNSATHILTASNGCDSIVRLNLTINNNSTVTDTIISCGSYTWIDGNTYTSSNNSATHILTASNGCDSIVRLNLTINNNSTVTDTIISCGSYIWIDGNTYASSNNSATHILTASNGCDSVVTINLTIKPNRFIISQPVDLTVAATQNAMFSLTSSVSSAFLWQIDIGFGFQNISNAGQFTGVNTSQLNIFSVTNTNNNQLFRCLVTENGCTDTSVTAKLNVSSLSISEINRFVKVYPNPTNAAINIDTPFKSGEARVFSLEGRKVLSKIITENRTVLDLSSFPDGIYIMYIVQERHVLTKKVMVSRGYLKGDIR